MIIWTDSNWKKEIIFRQSKFVFFMKIIRILFFIIFLIFLIFMFLNYKQLIFSLSSPLYIFTFVIVVVFINSLFIFILLEFTKMFFWIYMLIWNSFALYRVWKLFSDNIDFIHLDDIGDFKFIKTNILEILFNFWKIIIDDNELDWKTLYHVDKPEKVVAMLINEKNNLKK